MVPPEMRQLPHVSFTQLDQYLRCPLRYRFLYVDRLEPEFVPAALAFGSGIHGAAAFLFRGLAQGAQPSVADVQGYFEALSRYAGDLEPPCYGGPRIDATPGGDHGIHAVSGSLPCGGGRRPGSPRAPAA